MKKGLGRDRKLLKLRKPRYLFDQTFLVITMAQGRSINPLIFAPETRVLHTKN